MGTRGDPGLVSPVFYAIGCVTGVVKPLSQAICGCFSNLSLKTPPLKGKHAPNLHLDFVFLCGSCSKGVCTQRTEFSFVVYSLWC